VRAAADMLQPVLALTSTAATIGLLAVFVVVFPALVHVLIGFAVGQVLGERRANLNYKKRSSSQG
jgi:hypothetical protein